MRPIGRGQQFLDLYDVNHPIKLDVYDRFSTYNQLFLLTSPPKYPHVAGWLELSGFPTVLLYQ